MNKEFKKEIDGWLTTEETIEMDTGLTEGRMKNEGE